MFPPTTLPIISEVLVDDEIFTKPKNIMGQTTRENNSFDPILPRPESP